MYTLHLETVHRHSKYIPDPHNYLIRNIDVTDLRNLFENLAALTIYTLDFNRALSCPRDLQFMDTFRHEYNILIVAKTRALLMQSSNRAELGRCATVSYKCCCC